MRRFLPGIFFILLSSLTLAQGQLVTGLVTSSTETDGLPGVSVVIKGTSDGAITDIEGKFSLQVPPGATLVFSFVGYQTQEIVYAGQTRLNILLLEESTELTEVVVIGYSSVQKRDITGSVATLKADNIKDISITGVDQALQGQVAGVQVVQSSGTPGGGIAVRIRGSTSINASNRPLYIIDGVPVQVGALSQRDFGGQDDNALALIPPGDIESWQLLKDASAKAMYGSRAANGVVLITTKRGRKAKSSITFDIQRGIVDITKKIDLLNSTQLLELQREAVRNAGKNPDGLGLIPGVTDAVNTNWQDAVLRTGIMQQYQMSASGGSDNTTYYLSGSYRDEQGVQLNNRFRRLSGVMNIEQKLNPKLTLGTNLTLARSINNRVKGDNFLDGVYSGAVKSLPYYTPYDENGRIVGPGSALYGGFPNFNPVGQALLPRFDAFTTKILGNVNLRYEFSKELLFRVQAGIDYNGVEEDQYESTQTAIGGVLESVGGKGYGVYSTTTNSSFISNATLSYNKTLNEKHHLSALLGTEIIRTNSRNSSVQGRIFPSDDFTYITSAGIVDQGTSFKAQSGLFSLFGEVKYDYADKYLLTLGMRRDGSSHFGPGNRFGYFPSVSAAWRISEESFFTASPIHEVVNDLKLRISAGLTGNERITNYQFLGTWSAATYNGNSGVSPEKIGNPYLKWESTRELNVGLDVSLLEGRIQLTADGYYNKTSDLLFARPYPSTTGFTSVFDNIAELENKGVELGLTTVNIDKQLKWTTIINLSRNLNKILFLADSIPVYTGYQANGVDGTNVLQVGQPLGTFTGLRFLGVDPGTGNAIYDDVNHDGKITNSDAVVIGNAQPKLIGGITNKFNYGRFDLSVFFQWSLGNKVLNFSKETLVNSGQDIQNNQLVEALRRWQKPGDITDVPRYELSNTYNNLHSSRFLEDGSYLRLKSLSFGYTLPPNLTARLHMERVRVFASATNLWTYTKYSGGDPEVSTLDGSTASQGIDFFTLPQVRTLSVGINAALR
ncbi:SusC/RagA family TonB-linked outer membrane protein [Chryseolinea lacunae]|uniref:TonB-dependent receptor n=1 Tax=Chryseolinea lacunae TaxID=2801331 RepID=A0ABS1L2U6_9BACT|nr:TonB-dependent receptor [Chryseolinea lacunae]MBL0745267.1 TonB-dependent receptor [Chryseolinea lacunae]